MSDDEEFAELRDYRRLTRLLDASRYEKVMQLTDVTPVWEPILPFAVDDFGSIQIGRWGGWFIELTDMAFNERIVLRPEGTHTYDHGWCFRKGGAAFLSALAWNPLTEAEPSGYKRRATHRERQPGETAAE